NQRLDLGPAGNIASNDDRLAAPLADPRRDLLARLGLAARDHHLGAERRHGLGNGAADAAARSGDDGDLIGEIERRRHVLSPVSSIVYWPCKLTRPKAEGASGEQRVAQRPDQLRRRGVLAVAAQG